LLFLHFLCFGASGYLFFKVLDEVLACQSLKTLLLWMYFLSTPLLMVHVFVWTEPPFLFLWMLYWYGSKKLLANSDNLLWALLIFNAILLVTLRHIGIFLTFPVAVWLLLTRKGHGKILLPLVHLILPLSCFSWWQIKVYFQKNTLDRLDHFAQLDFIDNLGILSQAIGWWFVPSPLLNNKMVSVVFAVSLFLFTSIMLRRILRQGGPNSFLIGTGLSIFIYILVLLTKGDLIFSDNERYMAMIFPMFLLLMGKGFEALLGISVKIKPYLISIGGAVVLYQAIRVIKNAWFWSGLT